MFLTGLLQWGGGEAELRAVFEEGIPGARVQVNMGDVVGVDDDVCVLGGGGLWV